MKVVFNRKHLDSVFTIIQQVGCTQKSPSCMDCPFLSSEYNCNSQFEILNNCRDYLSKYTLQKDCQDERS